MSELREILEKLARDTTIADRAGNIASTSDAVKEAGKRYQWSIGDAEQAILAWHKSELARVIGENKRATGDLDSDYTQGYHNGWSELRAEQRKRAGL